MRVNVAKLIARPFDDVFWDVVKHKHTYYWLKGGRGSTKSSFISIMIPPLLISHPNMNAVVLRKVGNTIRTSVYPQMQWAISELGLRSKFTYKASPAEIIYKPTGQSIKFFGVDDPVKIKSIKWPSGYCGIVWMEELDQFFGMEEIRSLNQSLLRGGPEYWEFCSYNPPKSRDNWVNEEALFDEDERLIHHSTYLGVPKKWLGKQFADDAERLKTKNSTAYAHEYLGEVTGTGGTVFENATDMEMSDDMISQFDRLYHGLDFGFAIDPLAYTKMYYDKKHEDLYIFDEIYRRSLMNKPAAELIRLKAGRSRVAADSAEPKSIAELNTYGVRAYGVKKNADSIDFGIKWLQGRRHIYIDKRRAPNTYREFVTYEYQMDRQGRYVSAYPDKNNHAIDSVRYALSEVMVSERIIPKRINY